MIASLKKQSYWVRLPCSRPLAPYFLTMEIKPIKWLEALYWVTKTWEVFSYRRNIYLKKHKNDKWYFFVKLQDNCKKYVKKTCRIVAENWLDGWFEWAEVNHKDWNKENDNVENLEWLSKSENHKHAWRTWLRKATPALIENWRKQCRLLGIKARSIDAETVQKIRDMQWKRVWVIARELWVSRFVVWRVLRWKTYIDL